MEDRRVMLMELRTLREMERGWDEHRLDTQSEAQGNTRLLHNTKD